MLLEEIRRMAKARQEAMHADPEAKPASVKFADSMVRIFSNSDYILQSPPSLIMQALFAYGIPIKEVRPTYDKLIEELTRTFPAVEPSQLRRDDEA